MMPSFPVVINSNYLFMKVPHGWFEIVEPCVIIVLIQLRYQAQIQYDHF